MGDFIRVGLPNLICPKRGNRNRLPVQRHELDFVSFATAMDVHNGADIAGFQAISRKTSGQDNAIVFADIHLSKG